jgi:hypothetical protein
MSQITLVLLMVDTSPHDVETQECALESGKNVALEDVAVDYEGRF